MAIYESQQYSRDKLWELRKWNVCKICGGWLNVFWDADKELAYLACNADQTHEGIAKEASEYQKKGLEALNIPTRREIMTSQLGEETTRALEKYQSVTSLTRSEAKEILKSIFPSAPETEMTRAILLCASYGLNPLMGHVFLIPFNKGEKDESWATVIGIKAKRLLASRKRPFSYIDDTPRIMTEKEQVKRFGEVKKDRLVVLVKLKDPQTNAEAVGYGEWKLKKNQWNKDKRQYEEVDNEPYGMDKGNSMFNMATIRGESQALDRLCPGEMPVGVEVVDESYVSDKKEGIVEGEYKIVEDKPQAPKAERKPAVTKKERVTSTPTEFPPTTTGALLDYVCQVRGYGSHQTARQFLTDKCKVAPEDIDKEPAKVFEQIKELIG